MTNTPLDTNTTTESINFILDNNTLPQIRTGTDDFKTLLLNSDIFVDKSLMIKELLHNSNEVILITRPRNWGKSLNLDMLRKFFEIEVDEQGKLLPLEQRINNKLFLGGTVDLGFDETKNLKPLKIADDLSAMKRQGQFPVISISFKDVKGNSHQEVTNVVRNQVTKLFLNHRYLKSYIAEDINLLDDLQKKKLKKSFTGELDKEELKDSLVFLSELLFKHFGQKVYILIDEYDTPINSSYIKFGDKAGEFEQVLELFRGLFGRALKSNPYLEKGVMTGILRMAKANLFSDLNNVTEYTLLDEDFSQFYGFTQAEVDCLLTKVSTKTSPQEIKDWYNGYTFGSELMYNPWSIMQCLSHEGRLKRYWLDSRIIDLVDKALLSDEIQQDLQNLITNNSIVTPITRQINFHDINKSTELFSLLLFSGYLSPAAIKSQEDVYELIVPNKEIKNIYSAKLIQWISSKLKIDSAVCYAVASLLQNCKIGEFEERLKELLLEAPNIHQTCEKKAETFYSGFMLSLVNTLTASYVIKSETKIVGDIADIILLPKDNKHDNAIIIKYKISKTVDELKSIAKSCLAQIDNKQYVTKIKENIHVKKIIKIAIAFCGKAVALHYQIDVMS